MCTNTTFKIFLLASFFCITIFAGEVRSQEGPAMSPDSQAVQDTTELGILDEPPVRIRETRVMLDDKVTYSAEDTIFHDIRNSRVYIYGNADLQYEDIQLQAAYIEIDFNTNELYARGLPDTAGVIQGKPLFREGMQSFQSDELRYNFETRRGRTIGVITEEADGYVHGEVVKLQPSREVHVADGKYTTCSDPDPHFHIAFRRAKIIPNDKIVSSFAYLVIMDVPTPLFIPFGFFPNKRGRASGILIPSYGESSNRGFYLENGGFYWGINDYVDMSLRGDIFSRGSWALRLGSNYAVRYRYSGNLHLSYAINVLGEQNLPGYERSRDFRIQWSHSQAPQAHPSRSFRASVNAGSRQASRFNPISDDDYLTNTFSSNVSYSRSWANRYNFSANLRHSQNTQNRMVDLGLPEITFGVNQFFPFRRSQSPGQMRWYENISVNYNMAARNQLSIVDSLLFTQDALNRFRSGARHEMRANYDTRLLNHFNFNTGINYSEKWYLRTIRREWDEDLITITPTDTIFGGVVTDTIPGFRSAREFNFSSGISTQLFGLMQFTRGPVTAVRHRVVPSVSFSVRPDFADPFWGYYKEYYDPVRDKVVQYSIFEQGIYGGPPSGQSGNIGFSINNNLEMKVRNRRDPDGEDRKISLIDNFTVSGGYDLARDSLNFSDIRLSGRTRLFGNFDISYSSSWTPYARNEEGQLINEFIWNTDRKLLQLNNTRWTLNLNYNLRSGTGSGRQQNQRNGQQPGAGERDFGRDMDPAINGNDGWEEETPQAMPTNGVDYSVPWNISFSYSFNYNTRYQFAQDRMDRSYMQNLGVRGDVHLTPKWRIGFRTGYDFDNNRLTFTSIDVYRDLHCWEMTFNWIPMGFQKSYTFTIRVKSSVLQDLKLTRRTHHLDRGFF
ncbi:MAG: LPS-assembly protein LptD [Bacteroidia bacterium]|nr:MAG: LPS-assembly protein LptD [Bacteroidia bacterium]